MTDIPHGSTLCSLMYAQVCPRPVITYALSVLGRFRIIHWKAA